MKKPFPKSCTKEPGHICDKCDGSKETKEAMEAGEPLYWFESIPCCDNEKRSMNGGCDNCGAPSY